MNAIGPPIRAPRKVLGSPQPAVRNAREDWGQRYLRVKSDSSSSDKYPAGQTRIVSSETPRSGGSESRHDGGRGVAVSGGSPVSVQPRDSTFAAVPAKEMEQHGGHARHASRSTRARRDVSLDVRLTTAEREAIRDRARALGVKPSAWARAVMLDALDQRHALEAAMQQTARETPNPELAGVVEQLRRVGVNLNTTLRKGQAVDVGLLRAVLGAVSEVRAALGDRTSV
ncbi:plasmid mobilization protein [Leucobacter chromiireducens]|uniref:plasmid mobilization protein n=1 Tax=Leucobacter chromiireducens TaxID=283877 RepID=UPI001928ED07|nr:hypothetical protein [Leucobacter chromiireducens]